MALIVENGTGVRNAASYATVAQIDTYWSERTHDALYTTWSAGTSTTPKKEGAAREATAYLDAVYGPHYKGIRRGYVQGLLWPRSDALDEAGYPLPDLPPELVAAVAELAARAISARLSADADRSNAIKRTKKKVGPLETETEYIDGASTEKRFGVVEGIMASLVTNAAGGGDWSWA